MLTEDEAKMKWCPFARYSHDDAEGNDAPSANRWFDGTAKPPFHTNPEPCRCIASACMAWRWASRGVVEIKNFENVALVDKEAAIKCGWTILRDIPDSGYCGLAGAPQ